MIQSMEVLGAQSQAYKDLVIEKSQSLGSLEDDLKIFKRKLKE